MEYPAEKLQVIRQTVHSEINKTEIIKKIQSCVEKVSSDASEQAMQEDVLQIMQEQGIVEDIVDSLSKQFAEKLKNEDERHRQRREDGVAVTCKSESQNKLYLVVKVTGGRAFLDCIQHEGASMPGDPGQSTFTISMFFQGQRVRSNQFACACEPTINETFLFEVAAGDGRDSKEEQLLQTPDQLHLILLCQKGAEWEAVAGCYLDWRRVLVSEHGRTSCSVEVKGLAAECAVTVGILDLVVELVPWRGKVVAMETFSTHMKVEENRFSERERLFYIYTKQWWKEFLQIRPSHSQRLIKIFSQDEFGAKWPVFSFVHPLKADWILESPRHAARFVSLIPYVQSSTTFGSEGCRREVWSSLHTLLSCKKGDCEDHALLLCSLLLGFGLQAYVCVGTKGKGRIHAWVVTLGQDGRVQFWESLTGQRFVHQMVNPTAHSGPVHIPQPPYPYKTIGCLFNHQSFYANIQPSDSVLSCCFNLSEGGLWKCMSPDALSAVRQGLVRWRLPAVAPALGRMDPILVSSQLETELRSSLIHYRMEMGLETCWNNQLSFVLSSALSAYESERLLGVAVSDDDFQQAVRNTVTSGNTFKAFPVQFVHCTANKIFGTCLKSDVCREIFGCRGDKVQHGLRVTVHIYPEDVTSVWIMFAVQYKSVV